MRSCLRMFSFLLVAAMLLGMVSAPASALVVGDSNYTKIATLPNDYNATQGMCADDKYIYTFQSPQGNNGVAHFIRTDISSGTNVVMKYTDDTSITNFVELGHGNDMCAVVHEGVTYLYLSTMYHKSHSTYATHSIWKFKVSGNTLKKVAYYDVVQGTTNRNFTGLTLYKQDDEKVTLLGCLDHKFYEIQIPHDQASGSISCTTAFQIDFTSSLSISGAPQYNYTNSSGTKMYLVQGMHYSNGRIYYLMTAGTSNTPRSKNYILVYDISDYPENTAKRSPLAGESIYMTSSTYNYFMELESVTIRNGIMYFAANAGRSGYYEAYDFVGKLKTTFATTPEYTVIFCNEDGATLQSVKVKEGSDAKYTGATPTKAYDTENHYAFSTWLSSVGGTEVNLSKVQGDMKVYAGFTATPHSYSATVTQTPTCTVAGTQRFSCSCGYSYTEAVAMLSHSPETRNAKEATCTEDGYTGDVLCSVCGTLLETGVAVPILEHAPVKDEGYAATCTAPGLSDGSHCALCGTVLEAQKVIPAAEHVPQIIPGTPAGCVSSGLSDGAKCAVCGAVTKAQEVLPRLGHSYSYTYDAQNHYGTCIRCEKKQTQAHSYRDGVCVCGASQRNEDPALVINHNLNLASDISVNFVVSKSVLTGYDMETVYLDAVLENYEGNTCVGTETVKLLPVEQGSYYYFTLTGITAVQMNDTISATLHGTKNGMEYTSPVDSYSVAKYAYSQMNKQNVPQSLKTLCADLLRYGSSAQIYKGYRTDALADSAMDLEHITHLSDLSTMAFGNTNEIKQDLSSPSVTWVGKTLSLESKVIVKYVFSTEAYTGDVNDLSLRITYTDIDGQTLTATVEQAEVYNEGRKQYAFSFDGLLAAELRSVLSAQIYAGNKPVSLTMVYSPDTYGNGKTDTLGELCKALFAYSDSAKTYFQA